MVMISHLILIIRSWGQWCISLQKTTYFILLSSSTHQSASVPSLEMLKGCCFRELQHLMRNHISTTQYLDDNHWVFFSILVKQKGKKILRETEKKKCLPFLHYRTLSHPLCLYIFIMTLYFYVLYYFRY